MTRPPAPVHRAKVLAAVALAAAAAGLWWWQPWRTEPAPGDPFALPPVSASPYLNTGPSARYVGSAACQDCHADRHRSFRATGMGRSMAQVDPAREPADGSVEHGASRRRYEVVRRDGRVWHRELLAVGGPEVVLAEYPVNYVVGSGRYARTYLAEADGFLVESPVTWYSARGAWDMSPGYEGPDQSGFERGVGEACLFCHAGRTEASGPGPFHLRIPEPAIACERCHGPGSLHVERQTQAGGRPADPDRTIVNPAHLSRELAESICQQCHLEATGKVEARGRKLTDFRPGLPLADFVHAYVPEVGDKPMVVVGHVEQMHLSRCYRQSDSLTCVTCHSPHAEPAPEDRVAHYRAACQTCHPPGACRVDPARRQRESPANDCVHCHMPRAKTEVPHVAFTQHRIGVHDSRPESGGPAPGGRALLRPFLDLSRVPDVDRRRSLGLAYIAAAAAEKQPEVAREYRSRALDLLASVRAEGLRDPRLDARLARLRLDLGRGGALPLAEDALANADLASDDRCTAFAVVAHEQSQMGRHARAAAALRELTGLRRDALDWMMLAEAERASGDRHAMDEAVRTAVGIRPRLWQAHQYLAEEYRRRGDATKAEWHARRALP